MNIEIKKSKALKFYPENISEDLLLKDIAYIFDLGLDYELRKYVSKILNR
jgi:hypothetical protein